MSIRDYVVNGRAQDTNTLQPTLFQAEAEEDGRVANVKILKGEGDPVLFDLLWVLPSKPLAKSESFERTINVAAIEGRAAQKGTARTMLTGYAKFESHECARLVTDVDLEMSPAPPAEGRGRTRARIVVYFSVADRRPVFVEAAVATRLATRTKVAHRDGPPVWSLGTLDCLARFVARIGP